MSVQEITDSLITNPNQKVSIKGNSKEIIGFAEFRSINLPEDNYFKMTFEDHSALCIIPGQNLMLYTQDSPTTFTEITDEDIGNKKELMFRGKKYLLDNAHDYQYVVRLIKGDHASIEGEVKFSDYVPEDGASELLSLGWVVRTGERADVNTKELKVNEIQTN